MKEDRDSHYLSSRTGSGPSPIHQEKNGGCPDFLDVEGCREQFPALARQVGGRTAVFLDGPGGTQVPRRTIDAMARYLSESNANSGGAFTTSRETEEVVAAARGAMADLLGCSDDEIVFGPNMTTLAFSVSRALGRELQAGDEIVVTRMEHDANVAPWLALEERGARVVFADIHEDDCTLDLAHLAACLSPRTRLVAVAYASNAAGTINDVAEVTRLAHAAGALAWVDAVHYAPHGPIDVRALDCDFLACSPYKFFGPHLGALFGKREHLARLRPYKVRPSSDDVPERWETGTPNHEGLAGLSGALDYLAEVGRRAAPRAEGRRAQLLAAMTAIRGHERGLAERMIPGLLAIPGLTLHGIREPERFAGRTPTVAVRLDSVTPADAAGRLAEEGIFTWHGNYYALELSRRLGMEPEGMLRIGLVHYNTHAEVERLLEALARIARPAV